MTAIAERLRTAAEEIRDYPAPDAVLEAVCAAVAEQLRTASVRAGNLYTDPISGRTWHQGGACGGEFGGAMDDCMCFVTALALADAILGEAS